MTEAREMLDRAAVKGTILDTSMATYLMNKWGDVLKGIKDPHRKKIGAFMFESQAYHLDSLRNPSRLEEATTTQNVAYYTKYLFPILKKLIANLIAPDIVSVQPMNAPVGGIFYMDVYYGKSKGQSTAGSSVYDNFDRFYTSEFIDRERIATGNGVDFGGAGAPLSISLGWTPVRPLNITDGYYVRIREYDALGAVVQEVLDNGSGGFVGAAGTINYSNGAISGFLFPIAPLAGHAITAEYFYNSENNTLASEYYFDVTLEAIKARDRRLKARITSNAIEDFRAMHGMDAEATVTDFATAQIALEVDREIIMDLWALGTALAETFDFAIPAGSGYTDMEWYRTILTKMDKVASDIHKKNRRGPANFQVTSPDIMAHLSQLQSHGDYQPIWTSEFGGKFDGEVTPMSIGAVQTQFGVAKMGTLKQKYVVYQDPYFPNDGILIGYKGPSFIHAGYVYAPYIPIEVSATFVNPEDLTLVKGLKTRYAKKMLRGGSFYGRITCLNV